ncbi:hypothetical protein [Spirochaeta dissipatitropha]
MEEKKKKQSHGIEAQLNELFAFAFSDITPDSFLKMMNFIGRQRNFAPYNAYLLYLQRPTAQYFLTLREMEMYGRSLGNAANPLIILRSFGPVEFVFDLADTVQLASSSYSTEDVLAWLSGNRTPDIKAITWLEDHLKALRQIGIQIIDSDLSAFGSGSGKFFVRNDARAMAVLEEDKQRKILLRYSSMTPEYLTEETIGDIIHEAAHHLLGHLGTFIDIKKTADGRELPGRFHYESRSYVPEHIMEFEAEIVAFIVCSHIGLERQSGYYLRYWADKKSIPEFQMGLLLKTANIILKHKLAED